MKKKIKQVRNKAKERKTGIIPAKVEDLSTEGISQSIHSMSFKEKKNMNQENLEKEVTKPTSKSK